MNSGELEKEVWKHLDCDTRVMNQFSTDVMLFMCQHYCRQFAIGLQVRNKNSLSSARTESCDELKTVIPTVNQSIASQQSHHVAMLETQRVSLMAQTTSTTSLYDLPAQCLAIGGCCSYSLLRVPFVPSQK